MRDPLKDAGLMIVLGALTMLFGILLAEFLFPGYDVSENMISDLGAFDHSVESAVVFNVSIVLFGSLATYAAWTMREVLNGTFVIVVIAAGISAIFVGVVNEHSINEIHYIASVTTFLFGSMAIVLSTRHVRHRPLATVYMVLATVSLISLMTLGMMQWIDLDMGLGPGAVERLIAYPIIYWALMFGIQMMCIDHIGTIGTMGIRRVP